MASLSPKGRDRPERSGYDSDRDSEDSAQAAAPCRDRHDTGGCAGGQETCCAGGRNGAALTKRLRPGIGLVLWLSNAVTYQPLGQRMELEDVSSQTRQTLQDIARSPRLHRRYRTSRYDPGDVIEVRLKGVWPPGEAEARLRIDRFVGGGFAGQVYRAELADIETDGQHIAGLTAGGTYALKILSPPSRFSLTFRNLLYWIAYQAPFSLQVNEHAARAGLLWQKLVRRGAAIRFGTETAVVDTYASFYDTNLRSFGEVNEWVDGRVWKFEVDDRFFERDRVDPESGECIGPPEYMAKRQFMSDFVQLLHDMGCPELARQYEWWTAKSQPNVLKRLASEDDPSHGLTAIDFRAGLALLPFLPMSPADFTLIDRGLSRGAFVQFDRGDVEKLGAFISDHAEGFAELAPALDELRKTDSAYRDSLIDITHHWTRLGRDMELRDSIVRNTADSWQRVGLVDQDHARRLVESPLRFKAFWLLSLMPLIGKLVCRLWGDGEFRKHVAAFLTSVSYALEALRVMRTEALIEWHRDGRVSDERAIRLADRPVRFWAQRILVGWLPPKWHRFVTEPSFARACIKGAAKYVWRLYFEAEFREQWLMDQVRQGREEGMLTEEEHGHILGRIKDPFIQKYLKSLAVHVCTLPVTQVVSVIIAAWAAVKFGKTFREAMAYAGGVLLAFQVMPVSPGSIVRGSYVVYLMISERNFRNYRLALIAFLKYIGYLAFPLQMVTEYPALARFMAGRWATGAVHIVPVFGEHGALLEHTVFDLFFNVPLSLRRKWSLWRKRRRQTGPT